MPVVRAMPNAPATVHEGIAGICAGAHASDEHLALAEECLSHLGAVVRLPERYMELLSLPSGVPARRNFAPLAEAMIEAGHTARSRARGVNEASRRKRCSAPASSSATLKFRPVEVFRWAVDVVLLVLDDLCHPRALVGAGVRAGVRVRDPGGDASARASLSCCEDWQASPTRSLEGRKKHAGGRCRIARTGPYADPGGSHGLHSGPCLSLLRPRRRTGGAATSADECLTRSPIAVPGRGSQSPRSNDKMSTYAARSLEVTWNRSRSDLSSTASPGSRDAWSTMTCPRREASRSRRAFRATRADRAGRVSSAWASSCAIAASASATSRGSRRGAPERRRERPRLPSRPSTSSARHAA